MKGAGATLFLIFLVLKLTGLIDWSWWLVTLPLWIPLCILFAVAMFGGIVLGIFALTVSIYERITK